MTYLFIEFRARQRLRQRLAFGEALNGRAGIAEQYPAGAVAIQQGINHGMMGVVPGQQLVQFTTKPVRQGGLVVLGDGVRVFLKPAHHLVDTLILLLFLPESVQVMEPGRVQQAQPGKVTGNPDLFRGGRQQQQALAGLRQVFHHFILGAGLLRRPGQVVRFIHYHQVPAGGEGMVPGLFAAHQEVQAAQHQLVRLERVNAVIVVTKDVVYQGIDIIFLGLEVVVAALVDDGETQVEAAQHFHQPLVNQRIRHHNQGPAGAAGVQLVMQDQAGFDGFTQAHFIGQQYPGRMAPGHFVGDIELVRQMLGPGANQPLGRRGPQAVHVLQGRHPQPEGPVAVELAGKQALMRSGKVHRTGQLHFRNLVDILAIVGVVKQNAVQVLHGAHNVFLAFESLYFLTLLVHNPRQGSIIDGVGALLIGRGKAQCDPAPGNVGNNSQTQSGIAVAYPTLTNDKFRCFQETSAD